MLLHVPLQTRLQVAEKVANVKEEGIIASVYLPKNTVLLKKIKCTYY